jgi:translation initiation factor IF-3
MNHVTGVLCRPQYSHHFVTSRIRSAARPQQDDVFAKPSLFFSLHLSCIGKRSICGFHSNARPVHIPPSIGYLIETPIDTPPLKLYESRQGGIALIQTRSIATKRNSQKNKKDDNAPLTNEYLIAEILALSGKKGSSVSADTCQVRLIIDSGGASKSNNDEKDEAVSSEASAPTTQIVTLNEAISIANKHSLDLMEVSLKGDPPVVKALDFDKFVYQQKRKESKAKSKDGVGSISDKALKEFKFRAGIADHDLQRKASNMIEYLTKGHAVRVTLTARQRMLNEDAEAIKTTLDRVKELVGDKAVEVRGMKSNDRGSYANLLLHPSSKK